MSVRSRFVAIYNARQRLLWVVNVVFAACVLWNVAALALAWKATRFVGTLESACPTPPAPSSKQQAGDKIACPHQETAKSK